VDLSPMSEILSTSRSDTREEPTFVPEGHPKIAHRFNGGFTREEENESRQGRKNTGQIVFTIASIRAQRQAQVKSRRDTRK
jgi:hypothetical protein